MIEIKLLVKKKITNVLTKLISIDYLSVLILNQILKNLILSFAANDTFDMLQDNVALNISFGKKL